MTVVSRGSSIKGTVQPECFDDQVKNDKKVTAMRNELHKVSNNKPDKATYTPKEKKTWV